MHVIAPTWRSTGDISIKDDVMEEVARMYGYDNFEPTSFTTTFDSAINQKDQDLVRNMKEFLAIVVECRKSTHILGINDVYLNAIMQTDRRNASSFNTTGTGSQLSCVLLCFRTFARQLQRMSVTSMISQSLRKLRYSMMRTILRHTTSLSYCQSSAATLPEHLQVQLRT